MKKEFFEKFKEDFNSNHLPRFIRQEVFENEEHKRKVVAFLVKDIDLLFPKYDDFIKKSNEVLNKEREGFNEAIMLYEWVDVDFLKVEDIKKQDWFVL